MMDKIEQLKQLILSSNKIVFLTGAGVSTSSGISDFESIYSTEFEGYKATEIMYPDFFYEHPDIFLRFIKTYFSKDAKPNIIHKTIVNMSKVWGKDIKIITQNTDRLHTKAGSVNVYEIHGNLDQWRCCCNHTCKSTKTLQEILKMDSLNCEDPNCDGLYKPDVVLYGEKLKQFAYKASSYALENADLLIVVGTNLETLAPQLLTNSFLKTLVVINKHPIQQLTKKAELEIYGDAKDVFKKLDEHTKEILEQREPE